MFARYSKYNSIGGSTHKSPSSLCHSSPFHLFPWHCSNMLLADSVVVVLLRPPVPPNQCAPNYKVSATVYQTLQSGRSINLYLNDLVLLSDRGAHHTFFVLRHLTVKCSLSSISTQDISKRSLMATTCTEISSLSSLKIHYVWQRVGENWTAH